MTTAKFSLVAWALFVSAQDGPVPNHPDVLKPRPGSEPTVCDRKHVGKMPYCTACKKFLDGSQVVDSNFCKACNESKPKKEWVAAERRWACTKVYYACETHNLRFWISGLCPGCNRPFNQVIDRIQVKWKCSGCGKEHDDARCTDEACRKSGRSLESVCPKSKTYPHVAE